MGMDGHEPECDFPNPLGCICGELRAAYQRGYTAGYNDHARAAQHWQDTHGAYRATLKPSCPWCAPGGES
jgi:hypothetical protein